MGNTLLHPSHFSTVPLGQGMNFHHTMPKLHTNTQAIAHSHSQTKVQSNSPNLLESNVPTNYNLVILDHIAEYLSEEELCKLSCLNQYCRKYIEHPIWKIRYLKIVCKKTCISIQNGLSYYGSVINDVEDPNCDKEHGISDTHNGGVSKENRFNCIDQMNNSNFKDPTPCTSHNSHAPHTNPSSHSNHNDFGTDYSNPLNNENQMMLDTSLKENLNFPYSIPLSHESFFLDYKKETMGFLIVEKKLSNVEHPNLLIAEREINFEQDTDSDTLSAEDIGGSWENDSLNNENFTLAIRQRELKDEVTIADNDSWSDSQDFENEGEANERQKEANKIMGDLQEYSTSEIARISEGSYHGEGDATHTSTDNVNIDTKTVDINNTPACPDSKLEEDEKASILQLESKHDKMKPSNSRVLLELPLDTPSDAETPTDSDIVSDEDWDISSPKRSPPTSILDEHPIMSSPSHTNDSQDRNFKSQGKTPAIVQSEEFYSKQQGSTYTEELKYKIVLMLCNVHILKETYLNQDVAATIRILKDLKLNHKVLLELNQHMNSSCMEGIKVKVIFFQRPEISFSPVISTLHSSNDESPSKTYSPMRSRQMETKKIISGVIIGSFLLYYDDRYKLVIPKKLTGEALKVANTLVSVAEIFHFSFFDVRNIIANCVIDFNRSNSGIFSGRQANCQVFVDILLNALGLDRVIHLDSCGLAFSNTIKDLRSTGWSELTFTINHDDSTYSTCTKFKSHQQLDTFVNHLLNEQPTFPIENVFDFALLKCFDSILQQSQTFEEKLEHCPFQIELDL